MVYFLHSSHFHLEMSKAARSLEGPTALLTQHMDMVTLMPRLPLSANSWAMEVSNTRQSEFIIAELTPSWIDLKHCST